uniref:TBC1 domain family member 21 n=1 Tax=Laticauda laticaudata TaxID=8630 RepID=A0A8C5SDL6_LATLA
THTGNRLPLFLFLTAARLWRLQRQHPTPRWHGPIPALDAGPSFKSSADSLQPDPPFFFSTESDVQRLYIKDAQGNPLVDKKQLEKILLLNYVCNLNAEYQQGFHEMLLLFRLLVEKEHEIYWLFQFFLQKTENSCIINVGVQKNLVILKALIAFMDPIFAKHLGQVVSSLFPWFCLFFQRVFKSFEDVWRMWEVFLTGHPCKNFQVIIAYTMLQMVRDQILREDLEEEEILMLCHSIVDLDADDLITRACNIYELFLKHEDKVKNSTIVPCSRDLEGMILMISHARRVNL